MEVISVRVPKELEASVKAVAAAEGITPGQLVRSTLEEFIITYKMVQARDSKEKQNEPVG